MLESREPGSSSVSKAGASAVGVAPQWPCLSHLECGVGRTAVVAQPTRLGASVLPSLVLEVRTVPGEQLVLVHESLENASSEVRRSTKGSSAAGQVYSA